MAKRSLSNLNSTDLLGKRVLVRVDFNVPLNDAGEITDDTRIRAALPTIQDLQGKGARIILAAHFGRPKGKVNDAMRLTPVAKRLSELLGKTVAKSESCIGNDAEQKVQAMEDGDVVGCGVGLEWLVTVPLVLGCGGCAQWRAGCGGLMVVWSV